MSGLASLASGSERYHFGMHWNGGETYNVIGYLGKGAFANVYQLATKLEGSIYAVKELEKRNLIKNGTMNFKVHSELEIMKNLRHVSGDFPEACILIILTLCLSSLTSSSMSVIMTQYDISIL